jgi:hypothetical protein
MSTALLHYAKAVCGFCYEGEEFNLQLKGGAAGSSDDLCSVSSTAPSSPPTSDLPAGGSGHLFGS